MPPNCFLGPSEASLEFSSTTNGSKDSNEVLTAQEGITKCLASGGASAQNLFSPFSGKTSLYFQLLGELPPSLFGVVLCEAASASQKWARDLIYISMIHAVNHLILGGYTQGWREVVAGSSEGQA